MAKSNGSLTGAGAAYIRVSDDQQDTERQFASIRSFEKRHDVSISKQYWFKDEGFARNKADTRPAFNELLKLVESGRIEWIVVDALDRFGTKNAKQLMMYLYRLEEAGCKLFDSGGKEWTGEDIATIITAVIEGETSIGEQTGKSHRVLGDKIEKARAGEWQGGPVRFGFDVVCYAREMDKELWRVVVEGKNQRLKVYPDGRSERFDGKGNFPKSQPVTEVLRLAPGKDKAKVEAAVSIFNRFATESISLTALAQYLNELGWRNSYGGFFQSHHIESMIGDPIYLGFYTWNRRHFGKFHRYTDDQVILELNYNKKLSKNQKDDWVQSQRLFKPLVNQKTWDAVQKKLEQPKRKNSPRSAELYLSGLVYCGNCGSRMVASLERKPKSKPRKDGSTDRRVEYRCGTYAKATREGWREECSCLRNSVFQYELDSYIEKWLEETSRRLEIMAEGHLLSRLDGQEADHWSEFRDGISRLTGYLAEHHAEDYDRILKECDAEDLSSDDFVSLCVKSYRANFDPTEMKAEADRLESEHTELFNQWADLPTPLAKEKARKRFEELEAQIEELRMQQNNVAEDVETHYREMYDLQLAIANAKLVMRKDSGERSLRQLAEALRGVIERIECTFTTTGKSGGGWGKKNAELVKVTIYPISGDSAEFSTESKGTVLYSNAHSRMKRTRLGTMRYTISSGFCRLPRYCCMSGLPSQISCRISRSVTTSALPVMRIWS